MSMQDTVADLLTRIRNAQMANIAALTVPYSTLNEQILAILQQEGFIEGYEKLADGHKKNLAATLKYYQGRAVIEKIKRISRPGLRVYRGYKELPVVRGGFGIAVISTSKGVMTDKIARAHKLGGEVICTVE